MLVMGQKQQLLWDLPPAETFELNRAIYEIDRRQFHQTLEELVAILQIEDLTSKPTRQLSLGERMKCELVAALLHRPRVLFLDEPTIGLDVTTQAAVRRFIQSYNERYGATVILTSHHMVDVSALCPRVLVIDHGHLTYDGSLEELVRSACHDKQVSLQLAHPVPPAALLQVGGEVLSQSEAQVVLRVGQAEMTSLLQRALALLPVEDITVEDPPLEDILVDLFARPREEANDRSREEGGA